MNRTKTMSIGEGNSMIITFSDQIKHTFKLNDIKSKHSTNKIARYIVKEYTRRMDFLKGNPDVINKSHVFPRRRVSFEFFQGFKQIRDPFSKQYKREVLLNYEKLSDILYYVFVCK